MPCEENERFFSKQRKFQLLKALNEAFGAWENSDIEPESFLEELRNGNRLKEMEEAYRNSRKDGEEVPKERESSVSDGL
ncbi:hypothetical protein [Desulfurobacterium crinifex]